MTGKSRPDALVAKNASDFDAMTQAIEEALKKIERDRRLKPTQTSLAKLAGCTRGTLNNRGWPLTDALPQVAPSPVSQNAPLASQQHISPMVLRRHIWLTSTLPVKGAGLKTLEAHDKLIRLVYI